jgi:hypothetical protein
MKEESFKGNWRYESDSIEPLLVVSTGEAHVDESAGIPKDGNLEPSESYSSIKFEPNLAEIWQKGHSVSQKQRW